MKRIVESRSDWPLLWLSILGPLQGLAAARQRALPTYLLRSALMARKINQVADPGYIDVVSAHRILTPLLEQQGPPERALARALHGLGALGPIPLLRNSMHPWVKQILGISELWTQEQAKLARKKLEEALTLVRKLPTTGPAALESLASVTFAVGHLASQLEHRPALDEAAILWFQSTAHLGLSETQSDLHSIFA